MSAVVLHSSHTEANKKIIDQVDKGKDHLLGKVLHLGYKRVHQTTPKCLLKHHMPNLNPFKNKQCYVKMTDWIPSHLKHKQYFRPLWNWEMP